MIKQLRLRAELKARNAELEQLEQLDTNLKTRAAELETALSEAKTEDDLKLASDNIAALENEEKKAEIEAKKTTIKEEIQRIENELKTLDAAGTEPPEKPETERGKNMEAVNRYQIRELLKTGAYYERSEVKEFYEKFKNLRSVTGGELTIPTIVVDRILDILGDYCTVYPLVDKIRIKGKTRILIDTDTTPATWIEQTGAIPTGDVGTITNVDFDGYKVGKVTFVDNSILEDSIINLDDYVVKKLARAMALALDKATLLGTGSTDKQPTGIIPSLEAGHKVSVNAAGLADIVKPIGLVDTGEDSVGEIVAVMKRQTYYNRLLEYSIQTDSSGNVVGKLPNLKTPDLLGLRVVFNNNLPADQILYGDFSKYTMVERESISIDKSEHVKFVEDQTGYRGKGRFDGKPTNKNAFVLATLTDTPNA